MSAYVTFYKLTFAYINFNILVFHLYICIFIYIVIYAIIFILALSVLHTG